MNSQDTTVWAVPGPQTDLTDAAGLFEQIPANVQDLCKLVQGLLSNVFWMEELEDDFDEDRLEDVDLRRARQILERVLDLDQQPLQIPRLAEKRVISNARGYALLFTALLRLQGIPARLRCGFSAYFKPGLYLDHWVTEVWHSEEGRWLLVDPQLDAEQREDFRIKFSPFDVPRDAFLTAGDAWQLCRDDEADPDNFGLYEFTGMWFIRGSLVRDVLALAKVELLPWDSFGLIAKEEEQLTEEDMALLDELAELSAEEEVSFEDAQGMSERPGFRPQEL